MSRTGWLAAAAAVLAVLAALVAWTDGSGGTPPAASGATLLRAKGCASCHPGPDSAAAFEIGPPLGDASAWAGTRRDGMDAATYLRDSIRTPGAFISPAWNGNGMPGGMPDLGLSEAEIDAIVDYLLQG